MEIKDKVIIVTGASEGIGLATAKYLAAQGAKVVMAARSADKLEKEAKEILNAIPVPTDMRNPEEIQKLISRTLENLGRIDILINNAAQGIYGPLESMDVDQFKQVMELNVFSVLRAMQLVIPEMKKQGGGMILNVSSMVSKNYYPGLAAYAATKYALNALSLTARAELAKDNIIVSVMHPRMTATNFGVNAINTRKDARATGQASPNVDTAEQVAEKIGELIRSEEAEMMMTG